MRLDPLTIQHVLDGLDIFASGVSEEDRAVLRRASETLRKTFGPYLEVIPEPTLLPPRKVEQESVSALIHRVADYFQCSGVALIGRDRHKNVSRARHVAAWFLRERRMSFPEVGLALRRDHTTIMSSVRLIEKLRMTDPTIARAIADLTALAAEDVAC